MRNMGLLWLGKRRLRKDFINVYKYLKEGGKQDGTGFFLVVPSGRTRNNGHFLKQGGSL